jgi:RecA/RadA recombinase
MQQKSLFYADYWRNSLADSELGRGGFKKGDFDQHQQFTLQEFETGQLKDWYSLFKDEAADSEVVTIILRPYVYEQRSVHGKRFNLSFPQIVTPVVVKAVVDRLGRLFPLDYTVVPRDILEPLDRGSFSVSTVDDLDEWLTKNPHPYIDRSAKYLDYTNGPKKHWSDYIKYFHKLVTEVLRSWPDNADPYLKTTHGLLSKDSKGGGSSLHIIALYDHLQQRKLPTVLFDRFASEEQPPVSDCLAANFGFSLRLGHASDTYSLADAQRDAMTHYLVSERGDILAVNGPPGTGKTTLLLSIVASHMVQSAVTGSDPKLIAAASTNNQAVTNIIDAFAKDFSPGTGPFAGRWLPGIKSFGAYFPSSDKEQQAATKYQTRSFFSQIETPGYFAEAKTAYLAAAQTAYPKMSALTVQGVVNTLQDSINTYAKILLTIESSWRAVESARDAAVTLLGKEPHVGLAAIQSQVIAASAEVEMAKNAKTKWEAILSSEQWWMTIFSWIKAVAKRRFIAGKLALKTVSLVTPDHCSSIDEISTSFDAKLDSAQAGWYTLQQELIKGEVAMRNYQAMIAKWHTDIAPVIGPVAAGSFVSIAEVDKKADTEIRFKAFLLATHYWEGRWLLEIEALIPNMTNERTKNGERAVKPRWMRRMMIAPCLVSTFYMLPSEMKISRYDAGAFAPDYLYEFIDLLIVDEAGQVLPEVAAASFALAKIALVIGDVQQLAPISVATPSVDIGNMLEKKLLNKEHIQKDYNRLIRLGKTSAAGSVMRVAQWASRYHYDKAMARGMFLYEHRRCYNEIINYCNDLCYRGKLIPMRGTVHSMSTIPAMGYLHINGKCIQSSGASRRNELEAETIANWISDNKSRLEALYSGTKYATINQIVGVVSPFSGQVTAITQACLAKELRVGKGDSEMTVGTVHSLQGAERPIVIFSPAYSKHADGKFMDRSASMLNVAVSRAKDSFLVFGDMDIFNPKEEGEPRGLLAKYLFARPENALIYESMPRQDLVKAPEHFRRLIDAEEHDAFLLDVLATAAAQVHIVSPWLRTHQMRTIGLLTAMTKAATRGVKINVYADPKLNQDDLEDHWQKASEAFAEMGVNLVEVNRLHSKIVTKDADVLCIGSFNWLSAARQGDYARHETSMLYSGPAVGQEISVLLDSLLSRR